MNKDEMKLHMQSMMEGMSHEDKVKYAIEGIDSLAFSLGILLADVPPMVARSGHVLTSLANGFRHMIGLPATGTPEPTEVFVPAPITNVMGDDVTKNEHIKIEDANITNSDTETLKQEAIKAYDTFLERDTAAIIESTEAMVVRAVAIKAGMTGITPATPITPSFIEDIKNAITDQKKLEAATLASDNEKRELIEQIVELQKQTNEKEGREFTEADAKETREHFISRSIKNMHEVIKGMTLALQADSKEEEIKEDTTKKKTTTKK